jgi:tetratricopeptide (TPR) repeat protein
MSPNQQLVSIPGQSAFYMPARDKQSRHWVRIAFLIAGLVFNAALRANLIDSAIYAAEPNVAQSSKHSDEAKERFDRQDVGTVWIRCTDGKEMSEDDARKERDDLSDRLRKAPSSVGLLITRAAVNLHLSDIAGAKNDVDQALKIAPDNAWALYVDGQVKVCSQAYKEAIPEFEAAISKGFSDPYVFLELGLAFEQVGDNQRALESYAAAVKKNVMIAYRFRGQLYMNTGKYPLAIADFNRSAELGETSPKLFLLRAAAHQNLGHNEEAIDDYSRVIKVQPDDPVAYSGRGEVLDQVGKWDKGLADLDRAIKLQPDSVEFHTIRARHYFDHKETENAIKDIRECIRLNPGDAGQNYQPTTVKELAPEALAHGEEQVRRMLRDRPAMAKHVASGDKLRVWAARKFAGEDLDRLVDWESVQPRSALAESSAGDGDMHAAIRVASAIDLSSDVEAGFDDLWSRAVFELLNVGASRDWERQFAKAYEGSVTSDQFVQALMAGEVSVTQRTRAFYVDCYLPSVAKKVALESNPTNWYCFQPVRNTSTPLDANDYRPRVFATEYNLERAIGEFAQANFPKAKGYLDNIWPNAEVLTDALLYKAKFVSGQVNYRLGDEPGALGDLSKAIELQPRAKEAVLFRGQVYSQSGQFDKALDDFNRAIQLDPKFASALAARSLEFSRRHDLNRALADINEAIQIGPDNADWRLSRANVFADRKEFKSALKDFNKTIDLAPKSSDAYAARANFLYDVEDKSLRRPQDALKDAKHACELSKWNSAYELSILAGAYAALSDFDSAVEWQKKATSYCDPSEKEAYQKTLKAFQQGQK